jgi:uncharacterized repeat protein (TIGR01451 family)
MNVSGRKAVGYVMAGLIGLVIGYFAGREHLKYEMRSALQSAAGEIQRGLASGFRSNSVTPGPEKAKPPPASKPEEQGALEVALITKGFKASNPMAHDYEDDITFTLSVKNVGEKDIRAFDGTLNFTDLLDNPVMSLSLAINDPVGSGATLTWKGALKYNQFQENSCSRTAPPRSTASAKHKCPMHVAPAVDRALNRS